MCAGLAVHSKRSARHRLFESRLRHEMHLQAVSAAEPKTRDTVGEIGWEIPASRREPVVITKHPHAGGSQVGYLRIGP